MGGDGVGTQVVEVSRLSLIFRSAKCCLHLIAAPLVLQYGFFVEIFPVRGEADGRAQVGGASGDGDGGRQLVTLGDGGRHTSV